MDTAAASVHTGAAMEDLGFRFYAWLAAAVIGGGIALLILFLIFTRAIYAWGFFGAFLVLGIILLLIGWIYDRRQASRYEAE
jgi:hypothetical protein